MSVFLSYGRDYNGKLIHINESKSGRQKLKCPFCDCPLIGVKGAKTTHHFRHDGDTCNESLQGLDPLEGWSHFHLNYPKSVVELVKKADLGNYGKRNSFYRKLNKSYRDTLINGLGVLQPAAEIIRSTMPLTGFYFWMSNTLDHRIRQYRQDVKDKIRSLTVLEIEALRYYTLLNSTLYMFSYQLEDGTTIYKVGRTTRALEQRLKETKLQLQAMLNQKVAKADIVKFVSNCGFVEKYVFYKYRDNFYGIGNYQEYLKFDDSKNLKLLKKEFDELNALSSIDLKHATNQQKWVLSKRWSYERKRQDAARQAIKSIVKNSDSNFGRPKGTTISEEDYLKKYNWVVALLGRGYTMKQVAKKAKVSLSTVKRVKKILKSKSL